MKKVVVVGSGASGVHFALTLLEKGYEVTMLDVGYQKPEIVNPEDNISGLKKNLDDTVEYFLGRDFEAFIPPDHDSEYYGIPPSKNYVFKSPTQFKHESSGFYPLLSFAQGGLAETWTGGSYPLNDSELSRFPFSYGELEPYYEKVAKRIGISGEKDDLEAYYLYHDGIMPPLDLDLNSRIILSQYNRKSKHLNEKYGFYMGRSRIATLSQEKEDRTACASKGRCIWGCPGNALYTPSVTLEKCKKNPHFKYIPDMYVTYFLYDTNGNINAVKAQSIKDGREYEFNLERLVLAAGTLVSSKIFLASIYRKKKEVVKLKGLMDNRQLLVPFLNLRMLGKPTDLESYQYHQLAIYINSNNPDETIHGQITTCKSAMIHPIIKSIPGDFKTGIYIFRNFHSALGIVNINFGDNRRDENYLSMEVNDESNEQALKINYQPGSNEAQHISRTLKTVKKALFKLGCIVPSSMVHTRPMGASVHYSGTIPMSETKLPLTTTKYCQSNDFNNLYFVDGTTFPNLPAKNLTFTLMANAARVAEKAF